MEGHYWNDLRFCGFFFLSFLTPLLILDKALIYTSSSVLSVYLTVHLISTSNTYLLGSIHTEKPPSKLILLYPRKKRDINLHYIMWHEISLNFTEYILKPGRQYQDSPDKLFLLSWEPLIGLSNFNR